jgi:hypothetical protein
MNKRVVIRLNFQSRQTSVLQYATDLNLDYYVPGHGPTGNATTTVKPFLHYLQIVQDEVKKGYEQDLTDYEIGFFDE